ncbi:hypothetical protein [Vibrio nigripulchritudo]|uniref:hypothetical protein n=1 Tax=Vibrio nigripulchritudo TaxID=28173 RepID=UPI00190CC907|nr:hypothetical protein [Vibrio nigripulchritudo]
MSQFLFNFEPHSSGAHIESLPQALPISTHVFLSHAIKSQKISHEFSQIEEKLNELFPRKGVTPIKELVVKDFKESGVPIPPAFLDCMESNKIYHLSHDKMYDAVASVSKVTSVNSRNVHSSRLMAQMIASQFNATVGSEAHDLFNLPPAEGSEHEQRKARAEYDLSSTNPVKGNS